VRDALLPNKKELAILNNELSTPIHVGVEVGSLD
jgi:hypothetical protein